MVRLGQAQALIRTSVYSEKGLPPLLSDAAAGRGPIPAYVAPHIKCTKCGHTGHFCSCCPDDLPTEYEYEYEEVLVSDVQYDEIQFSTAGQPRNPAPNESISDSPVPNIETQNEAEARHDGASEGSYEYEYEYQEVTVSGSTGE